MYSIKGDETQGQLYFNGAVYDYFKSNPIYGDYFKLSCFKECIVTHELKPVSSGDYAIIIPILCQHFGRKDNVA